MQLAKLESEAIRLFKLYGLWGTWKFGYNNRKRSLGVCKYRSKRIQISRWHAENDPEEHVLDTLKHEIAHALAGKEAGHGPNWKLWAKIVGATPERCATKEQSAELTKQEGKWQGTCPNCRKVFHMHRKPKRTTGWNCRECGREKGSFEFVEMKVSSARKSKLF